jgi:hypothetical protein
MLCKPATLNLNAQGLATLTPAQVDNGSFDNCAIQTISVNITQFTCAQVGANTVTLNGTDASGNKGVCNTTVTVVDAIAPVALCKSQTINLPANGSLTLLPSQINNGSTDNCSFTMTLTPATLNCSNLGNTTVTLRATDASGNTATCTALVTLKDLSAPVALCKNATVFLDNQGQGVLTLAQIDNGSTDNCSIATKTLSQTLFNCSELQGSTWPVTMTLKDANNNTSSCTAQITVKDNIAPTANCQDVTVTLGSTGKVTVYGATLAAGSTDNCSVWSYSPAAKVYTTANLGENYLNITVKDYSNNASSCTSVVTVLQFGSIQSEDENDLKPVVLTSNTDFTVFPNPTTGEATVAFELPAEQAFQLQVFDMSGRMVYDQNAAGLEGENAIPVRLNGLAPGVYILDFQTEGLRKQKRLVIQQ